MSFVLQELASNDQQKLRKIKKNPPSISPQIDMKRAKRGVRLWSKTQARRYSWQESFRTLKEDWGFNAFLKTFLSA